MGNNPDPIEVSIIAKIDGLLDGLVKSSSAVKGATDEMKGAFTGLTQVVNNLRAPFLALAGVVGAGTFMRKAVNETQEWTVEAQKLSRVLGITTEQASILNLAIGDIYGTTDGYLAAVSKLTMTLNSNEKAIQDLGVKTRDANGHLRSTPAIMTEVNTKLAAMKSGTDRNVESQKIYGRSWMELQRYLKLTQEVMDAAREKAEKLNLIVGQDSVQATNDYRASMNDLDDTVKALKVRLGNELMPVLTDVNNAMADDGPTALTAFGWALKGVMEILDSIYSGLKMFAIAIGMVFRAIWDGLLGVTTWITTFFTTGKFSKANEAAGAVFKEMASNASNMFNELDRTSLAYTERQMRRWGELSNAPKRTHSAPSAGTDVAGGSDSGSGGGKGGGASKSKDGTDWDREAEKAMSYAKKIAQERAEYFNEVSDQELERSRQVAQLIGDDQVAAQKAALDQQRTNLANAVEDGTITREQELSELKRIRQQELDLDLSVIEQKQALYASDSVEWQQLQNQNLETKRQANADMLQLERSLTKQIQATWQQNTVRGGLTSYVQDAKRSMQQWGTAAKQVAQSVQSAFATCFKGILTGNVGFKSAMLTLIGSIGDAFIGMLADMAAKWVTSKLVEMVIGKQAAGSEAASNAAAYAVEAMKSVAAIPVTGWAMAPAVGAAAYATGMGYAALASAAGGWDRIPHDQLAMIHKDEKVLPASVANAERQFFENGTGGSSGEKHVHIHTTDPKSFVAQLRSNRGGLMTVIQEAMRDGRMS